MANKDCSVDDAVVVVVDDSVTMKISVTGAFNVVDSSAAVVAGRGVELWTTVIGSSGDKTFTGSSLVASVVDGAEVVDSVVLTDDSEISSVVVSNILVGRISSSSTSSPNKF